MIVSTLYFQIEEGRDFSYNNYQLRNGETVIPLINQVIINNYGINPLDLLVKNPYFIKEQDYDELDDLIHDSDVHLQALEGFFNFLWLIKDHSCNALDMFYMTETEKFYSRNRFRHYSNAEGKYKAELFTADQLREATDYINKYLAVSSINNIDRKVNKDQYVANEIKVNPLNDIDYNNHNKLDRAILFHVQSRSVSFLPAKIANGIIVLETLFSGNELGEITYKIGHRVANYIGGTSQEKLVIFKQIKLFYSVRSKFLHGQVLEKNAKTMSQLSLISVELDNILRIVLRKALDEPAPFQITNTDDLLAWFDEHTFPK